MVSLSFSAFIFVTTELVPVGLLTDIANSFARSEASTGRLLTVYAWMVALMSLPLTAATARINRRTLVLALLLLFAAGNAFAALAGSYPMLLGARICIALCHAVFWSIATPLAVKVAPKGKETKALGMIVAGGSVAMVLGVPVGTMLGHQFGWRFTFAVIGGAAFCIFLLLFRLMPSQPSRNAGSLKSVPSLFRRRNIVLVYILTVLTVTGHFTLSTYFAPYMARVGGFNPQTTAMLLLMLGGAGVVGSMFGSKFVNTYPNRMLLLPLCLLSICLAGAFLVETGLWLAFALCFFWGAAMTCAGLVFQTHILKAAPDATDVATAMYSGIFNIGIGGGALIGSLVFSRFGVVWLGFTGSCFILVAIAVIFVNFFLIGKSR